MKIFEVNLRWSRTHSIFEWFSWNWEIFALNVQPSSQNNYNVLMDFIHRIDYDDDKDDDDDNESCICLIISSVYRCRIKISQANFHKQVHDTWKRLPNGLSDRRLCGTTIHYRILMRLKYISILIKSTCNQSVNRKRTHWMIWMLSVHLVRKNGRARVKFAKHCSIDNNYYNLLHTYNVDVLYI